MRHEGEGGAEGFWPSLRAFSPDVAVMEAAHPAMRDDPGSATRPRLHRTQIRSVFLECDVAAVFGVVADILPKKSPEVVLVEDHHAIQQLAPAASDPALCHTVLPGAPRSGPLRLDAHRLDRRDDTLREEKIESRSNTR